MAASPVHRFRFTARDIAEAIAVKAVAAIPLSAIMHPVETSRRAAVPSLWGLLIFLLVGAIAGWLASIIMKSRGGLLQNLLIGIVGAFIGGFLFGLIGLKAVGILGNIVAATAGACLLLWIVGKVRR